MNRIFDARMTGTATGVDSPYAWRRLAVALLLATIGGVGLWSSVVILPTIQAEFGVSRGGASLPYSVTLTGFAVGGILMGRFSDRFGISVPLIFGAVMLGLGYALAALSQSYWQFLSVQALLIGMLGSSATFGPLVAEVSQWFAKRRGIAVAIVASGNYLAGTLWPPVLQYGIDTIGWRQAYLCIAVFCVVTMVPLALLLRRRAETGPQAPSIGLKPVLRMPTSRSALQVLLIIAGVACCVAMSMPQVHMIAYCVDLGYGAARGAELLSIMLGLGVVSRLISGVIADRIGGIGTLLIGSALQCLALILYLPFNGLVSLYVVSALFGLAQGGIVPSYALIVREYFPAREAGTQVSIVLMATVVGMALGGWMSGFIFDHSGSYQLAFTNGIAWNLLNLMIAGWLLSTRFSGRSRLRTA
jgi:MFS family permease